MNKVEFIRRVLDLGFRSEEYIVIGSGVMAMFDMRNVDDIDIVVSERIFREIESESEWERKEFEDGSYYLTKGIYEIGLDWDSENAKPNLNNLKSDQIIVEGIPFVSVERLIGWKQKKGRPKDIEDVKLLESYEP